MPGGGRARGDSSIRELISHHRDSNFAEKEITYLSFSRHPTISTGIICGSAAHPPVSFFFHSHITGLGPLRA